MASTSVSGITEAPGMARIKAEYLVKNMNKEPFLEEPQVKKLKISSEENIDDDDTTSTTTSSAIPSHSKKEKQRGQNKNRPKPQKFLNEDKLCHYCLDGKASAVACPRLPDCRFLHDVDNYLSSKKDTVDEMCHIFKTYGKCPRGLSCIFAASHMDADKNNVIDKDLWSKMEPEYELTHKLLLDKNNQIALRKHTFDYKNLERIYSSNSNLEQQQTKPVDDAKISNNLEEETQVKTLGAVTDADLVPLRISELKKLDWKDKLYLSPLTTVGNLPFRRLCVELGADITCSEMSLATSVLQGNIHEFALHRRHPSEKFWGVQLCANNGIVCAKAAHTLAECGIDYDFVDLNMGCPLEPIYRQGAGSGLMGRTNKFKAMVKGMTKVLASRDKAFTVKMRTGIKLDKNIAHSLIEFCRDNGVSAVTLHGRTREQRYLRYADWNYIGKCAKIAQPMELFGNGDVMSWDDYQQRKTLSNVSGVMIGRGALIKPWVFQEIKEQRNIDMTSSERLELIRKYSNYGLDHWGSDTQGVATTRRFLLEWLSFYHRYIPVGILEDPPQRVNQKPPKYVGRDEMETLLASSNSADWIKISEMFLGPVSDTFHFLPKHKANAWSNG